MPHNLAAYFASAQQSQNNSNNSNIPNNDDEDMGPSISMAVEAENDDEFKKSTFKLKRTRSMGLLGGYVDSTKKLLNEDDDDYSQPSEYSNTTTTTNGNIIQEPLPTHNYNQESENDSSYAPSASVSPPPPDNDKLLPQDDNDVVREPQRHVDYLSHHWKESEISNSWKYIIAKKKKRDIDMVNSARLENASWRTWAKARNHLKTVSPEIVNWSKDSDVTWLYGPIVRENKKKKNTNEYHYDVNNEEEDDEDEDNEDEMNDDLHRGYGSDGDECSKRISHIATKPSKKSSNNSKPSRSPDISKKNPKPILKRRTMTEIIEENSQWKLNEARKARHAALFMGPTGSTPVHDDYDMLAAKVNAQYYNYPPNQQDNMETTPNNSAQTSTAVTPTHDISTYSNDTTITQGNNAIGLNKENQIPYQSSLTIKNEDMQKNKLGTNTNLETSERYSTLSSAPQINGNTIENDVSKSSSVLNNNFDESKLSSILTTPSNLRLKGAEYKARKEKDRHIHFNDRVEQCEALRYRPQSNEERDSDFYSSDNSDDYNEEFSDYSDSDSDSNSNNNENDDSTGLFISARFSRRADSVANSPITDNSSVGSNSLHGRNSIRPIIKLLPATTLNYGSDEESDNSDYSGGYGNAVSHNVNTQRGYDYIYDYNSVYTGDTSNFLPVDSCDIVDVPEGMDLQTAIASDKSEHYDMLSPQMTSPNTMPVSPSSDINAYSSDDQYTISSNTDDDEFIEDSQYRSSDDSDSGSDYENDYRSHHRNLYGDNNLGLQRTVSMGRSNNSLRDLVNNGQLSSKTSLSHNLISGKPTEAGLNDSHSKNSSTSSLRGRSSGSIKRSSSKNFIFDSDSESDSDENENISHSRVQFNQGGNLNLKSLSNNAEPHRKLVPPRRSNSGLLATDSRIASTDSNKGLRIAATSPAEVVPSDVAINGYFSPRNESVKSVISKKKLMGPEGSHHEL